MSLEPDRAAPLARVLLVGFMGSGKSTVGRALADALDWTFVDFDEEIAKAEGLPVPEIFQAKGERYFREVEARVGKGLLHRSRVVLASGGGWAATPGRLDEVPPGTETFWLRVSAEEAVRRAATEPGSRPLLAGPAPLERAAALLRERASLYRAAGTAVDTSHRSVDDVTTEILRVLSERHPEVPRS